MIPVLTELREPPVVGRYYLVPTVPYVWQTRFDSWPVLGPLHHDKGPINFPYLHYHIDGRFLKARARWVLEPNAFGFLEINARPMSEVHAIVREHGPIPRKPMLAKRRCTSLDYAWKVPREKTAAWQLEQQYGAPALAISRPDGRKLCPHRKVDLSQILPDADGLVTCPLHGLRVQCGGGA